MWNALIKEDQLIQLAGHLEELYQNEICLPQSSELLSLKQLMPCILTGTLSVRQWQHRICHTMQDETELVSDFICSLERTFLIAYGCDQMSSETKNTLLHGQLQEGSVCN